jgi:hypothetical protein
MPGGKPGGLNPGGGPGIPGGANGIGGRARAGIPTKFEDDQTDKLYSKGTRTRTRRHHAHTTSCRHTATRTNRELARYQR